MCVAFESYAYALVTLRGTAGVAGPECCYSQSLASSPSSSCPPLSLLDLLGQMAALHYRSLSQASHLEAQCVSESNRGRCNEGLGWVSESSSPSLQDGISCILMFRILPKKVYVLVFPAYVSADAALVNPPSSCVILHGGGSILIV